MHTDRASGDESVTYPFQCLSYRVQIIRQRYYVVIHGGNFKRAARGRRPCCFLTLTTMSLPMTSLLMEYNDLSLCREYFFLPDLFYLYLYIYVCVCMYFTFYHVYTRKVMTRMCSEYSEKGKENMISREK